MFLSYPKRQMSFGFKGNLKNYEEQGCFEEEPACTSVKAPSSPHATALIMLKALDTDNAAAGSKYILKVCKLQLKKKKEN